MTSKRDPRGFSILSPIRRRAVASMAVAMALLVVAPFVGTCPVIAQSDTRPVRIGVLSAMSGPYADLGGEGSVTAAEMAVKDFGGSVLGRPVEVLSADHQTKPDVASNIARKWFDVDGVQMITDMISSPATLAIQRIGTEKKRITINTAGTTDALTNDACGPYGASWVFDSYAFGKALAVAAEPGSTWYFLTVDHSGGQALQGVVTKLLQAKGARVLGGVRFPLNVGDMSSFLLQAQASGAKNIAVIVGGTDLIAILKQAKEFGLKERGQNLVGTLIFQSDLRAMGPEIADGLLFGTGFYSGSSPEASAWAKRFFELRKTAPNDTHAGTYSGVLHYLKAVKAAGTLDADAVMAKMREMPVDDMFARNGVLRKDGRMVHDFYVVKAKTQAQSEGPLDLVDLVRTIPAAEAFAPLSESTCPLLK